MEFLTDLIGGGLSVASGGLFGLLGSGVSTIARFFQSRQEFAQERERRQWDREDFALQMKHQAQETEQEIALASAQGAWSGLEASIQADARVAAKGPAWAAGIRSMFRPFLTTLLVALSGFLVWMMWQGMVHGETNGLSLFLEPADMVEIVRYAIYSLLFSASTAVVWWFGDRAMVPPGAKGR